MLEVIICTLCRLGRILCHTVTECSVKPVSVGTHNKSVLGSDDVEMNEIPTDNYSHKFSVTGCFKPFDFFSCLGEGLNLNKYLRSRTHGLESS